MGETSETWRWDNSSPATCAKNRGLARRDFGLHGWPLRLIIQMVRLPPRLPPRSCPRRGRRIRRVHARQGRALRALRRGKTTANCQPQAGSTLGHDVRSGLDFLRALPIINGMAGAACAASRGSVRIFPKEFVLASRLADMTSVSVRSLRVLFRALDPTLETKACGRQCAIAVMLPSAK